MLDKGFKKNNYDTCVYMKKVDKFDSFGWIILVLYVDNILIVDKAKDDTNAFKHSLSDQFVMKEMKEAHHFLNLWIHRNQNCKILKFSQENYIRKYHT